MDLPICKEKVDFYLYKINSGEMLYQSLTTSIHRALQKGDLEDYLTLKLVQAVIQYKRKKP